ncbi:MAG: response regulator [Phycisphaerae bacterium]|nr:response regulator [Phycisphaerae bacterium]
MDMFKSVVILLVEDDPGDQKLIKKSLSNEKIINEFYIVSSGEEALEYLHKSKAGNEDTPIPDLILLDLNMPGMGGKEFLRLIKADDELCVIPTVILTTSDADRDILESYKLQAAGYIKKPVSIDEFRVVMQDLSEYWFIICKRVSHSGTGEHSSNGYFVGGRNE